MQHSVLRDYRSAIRIFSACLLTWLLIIMPLAPLAPASRAESGAGQRGSEGTESNQQAASSTKSVYVNAPVPQPAPEPVVFAPVIVATKDDGLPAATTVAPGGNISYTVTINNNGAASPADDATGVVFTDTIDAHTTLVPGSTIAAASDKYNTIGNVQISVPDGATDLLGNDFDPATGNNTGMTATAETKSSTNCTGGCSNNVTINANGSFTYDPPVGFSGTDTFTYTANVNSATVTATVTITVANEIWFINNNAGACSSDCNGRLSHPFTSLAAFNAANDGAAGHPGDNDWIFVFESTTAYTGPATLRLGQKFIGQDATASLISLTGFTQPSGTDPIPVMNSGNGAIVQITTAAAATNGINLNSGNTLRGFTVGNTTGAKISGNGFGTLLVGNSASPDVTLNGSGQALNLTNGTLSNSGRFVSVTTTSSGTQGIILTGVADSDGGGAGSFSFSSTTVSGSTTQGILIGTTPADLNFGNTSVTGGTDAISLQNNASGTRTFGNITTSGNSGVGFLHGAGGGAVNVTGTTTITNPGGNGIDIDSSNANLSFATTTVNKNNAGIGVDLTSNATRTISFSSLTVTTTTGFAINTNNSGTVNVTTGSLTQNGAGGGAASLTGTALGMTFTSVSSDGGANGLLFSGGSGTFTSATTNLQNNAGVGLSMSSSGVAANFGNTTVNSSAGDAVDLSSNTAAITFADLDLTPDSGLRGLDAQNNTGTITSTSGDIATTGGAAVFIDGPAGRTPLAMVLTNVDCTSATADGVSLTDISGSFAVNDPGTATNIATATGNGISVNNSTATVNFGNTTVANTTGTGISVTSSPSGSVTFGTTSVTGGAAATGTGISVTSTGASTVFGNTTVNGTGNANGDDTGTGVILTNNTGAVSFGALNIAPDSGERGLLATDNDGASAAGAITTTSGTITTTNDTAVQITGATTSARTPLNIQLTAVNTTGGSTAANGIILQNTSATGSPGGFRVLGNGGTCTDTTPTCTGGRITATSGADNTTNGNGVYLNVVDRVVLTRMRIDNHPNFAIRGFTVTAFTLDTSVVDGTNGNSAGAAEASVVFDDLFGTVAGSNANLITASFIKGGWGDNLRIANDTNTAGELTVSNCTIRDTNVGTNGNDNIHITSHLNANLKVSVTNSTFAATNGDHIQTIADGTSTFTIVVTGSTFSGGGGVNALGQGITISGGDINASVDSTETVRFNISNNTMNGTIQGGAVNINEGVGNGNWQGQVANNTIGTAAVQGSGASQSSGIRVENHSKGTLTAIVTGNTVRQWSTNGINLQAGDTSATGLTNGPLNVTVTSNTVANPNPASAGDHGIQLNIGVQPGNTNLVCADFQNNNSLGNAVNGGVDYRIRHRQNTTIRMPGYTGGQFDTAAVRTYILGRPNTANQANPNDVAAATSSAGGGYTNTIPAGSQCAQPTVPTASFTFHTSDSKPKVNGAPAANSTGAPASETVEPVESQSPGAKPEGVATGPSFLSRSFTAVANFAGAVSSKIMPTAHAAEISAPAATISTPVAAANQPVENVQPRAKVTSHHAAPSNRVKKSEANAAATSRPVAAAPMAGETVTANIGVLPAGGTVTIKFQVTVNNPPNLTLLAPPRVQNQGTVTGNGGINVLTDDPTVAGTNNPTVTLIDLFNTTTNLVSDINPSNFGEQVTFTATVSESPTQASADPTGTVDFIDTSNGNAVICNDVTISGGTAQCQTSSLTAGTHNIRADYSGDGNFDPSQSNIVAQVVNACTPNPVVTSTADSGAGSLREALDNVCTGNTITFNLAGAGPHTITLTTGQLVVDTNVTINNNSGESITVSGGGTSRVFNINAGITAAILGLNITGGNSTGAVPPDGGAILNDGALTVVNSALFGNTSAADGGAISTTATGTALTLINTTISGNSAAGSGGGLITLAGTVNIINSTFSNNVADSDNNAAGSGGGIRAHAGTVTLKNTIVAGNFNEDGASDAADDISGTVAAASSFNLIGTGGAGGLTNGVNNNQVGVANAGLGALGNNGGTTQTHALLPTSPAVETGSNANLPADTFDLDGDANTAETLSTDQRGNGFPRVADSSDVDAIQTVDIGAFELHPSVEDITDKSVAEDNVLSFSFNLGDGTGSLIQSVTATSGNTTLVPNANLNVTGSGTTRTLQITPALNANSPADGTATITVTVTATNGRTAVDTFVLTVTEVNDAPDAVNDTLTAVDEDSGLRVIPFADLLANDSAGPANESGQTITVTNVSNPVGGTVVINGTNVEFTLTPNFFGTASFDYTITDNGTTNGVLDAKSDTASVSFTVNPINDPPSFVKGADQTVNEDAGPQTVVGWATSISAGPNETQTLTFNVQVTGTTGNLAFSSAPAINATNGNLTYTTAANTNGTANLSVTLSDDGPNSPPPNSNTSAPQTFTITVNAVNDAPTFQLGANPNVNEDAGPQTINGFAFNFQPGPATATDEATQTLVGYTVTQTGSTGGLTFSATPAISNAGTLTFTADNDKSGTATFDVVATDSGPGTPPNVNQSAPVSFTITVGAVNDPPVNTVPGPQATNQNTPLTFSSGNGNQISVADPDAGSNIIQVTLTAVNGTMTLNGTAGLSFTFSDGNGTGTGDGTNDPTMTFRGTISDINTAMNGMVFNPTPAFSGAASLTIISNDLGNTGSGGPQTDTDVVNIQVSTNISIQDAQVAEPPSGSVNMIFTVTLSAPAPAGGVSVNFTTQDEPPSLTHATAGQDYTATNGTVSFAMGEQVKTIQVPVLADSQGESNETFLVLLSSPVNGTIADGTATGTILNTNQPGTLLISEIRTSGPAGSGDDFVEIYNNSDSPHTVNGSGGGYGLFTKGATCAAAPVLVGVIPNGTVIPGRGHYLFVGSAYSLANYGGTGAAAGDQTLLVDLDNDANVGLFGTASLIAISTVNRFDAVGFGANTGGTCDLLREGTTLPSLGGSVLEHSFVRDECGKKGNPTQFGPCPTSGATKDSNVNNNDFVFVDPTGTITPAGQTLGGPGPQNLGSARFTLSIATLLIDATKAATLAPNRVRDNTPVPNGANGTLSIRRRFVNNTGAPVTRLRFRIVDISALATGLGNADIRALNSSSVTASGVGDSATCLASTGSAATPCTITVLGTTLETPPAQAIGGGFNSSYSNGTITLGTPLAPGASINLQMLLGVQTTGAFKFFFNIEALP